MLRVTLDRSYRIHLPGVPILFGVMIGYALLTYAAIVMVIDYPRYDPVFTGFQLKNTLIDHMLFFLVFFYGLRSNEDALTVLKVLLAAWAVSHIMAVLDATGVFHIGDIEQRSDGQGAGAVGESNMYGAFVAFTLPATIAMMTYARDAADLGMAASVITAAVLVMTVSAVRSSRQCSRPYSECGCSGASCRCASSWCGGLRVGGAVLVGIVVISLGFGDLIHARLTMGAAGDLTTQSSGRTAIWASVLQVMFGTPLTLLTGFGWEAYGTFPFRWVTHNHYLQQWFNLGLIGLICSVLLLVVPIRTANAAANYAIPDVRPMRSLLPSARSRSRRPCSS